MRSLLESVQTRQMCFVRLTSLVHVARIPRATRRPALRCTVLQRVNDA